MQQFTTATVANADGTTADGKLYFEYSTNVLAPGESTETKQWDFTNSTRVRFSYEVRMEGVIQ